MEKRVEKGGAKRYVLIMMVSVCLLLAGIVFAVCVGKYSVSPGESLQILFAKLFGRETGFPAMTENVVLGLRVPRILASVLVGAALSMSGAAYQGAFKNPLVSQDILGVSSGACIGAALAILLSLTTGYISLFAFLGGLVAILLTTAIPVLLRNRSNIMLVLAGVIVGSAMSSVLGFLKYVADPDTQLASIVYWTMGSFSYVKMETLAILSPLIIVPAIVLISISWWIDVLSMGEDEARVLGANVNLVRGVSIACATLLTASAVCLAGSIGWVGLIVPHFGRMLIGPGNRRLMPLSAVLGGLFMLMVDTATRTIGVSEMPVSILTGVIGAPFYCFLLFRQRRSLS
ncbi:iron ABC transporter permease [Christensenellaceae bacterium OttesenSCG-928-L17]|nr:iron ABC transporter permease [Christensenellaceae bacterium OttesenSCG-928-L17]